MYYRYRVYNLYGQIRMSDNIYLKYFRIIYVWVWVHSCLLLYFFSNFYVSRSPVEATIYYHITFTLHYNIIFVLQVLRIKYKSITSAPSLKRNIESMSWVLKRTHTENNIHSTHCKHIYNIIYIYTLYKVIGVGDAGSIYINSVIVFMGSRRYFFRFYFYGFLFCFIIVVLFLIFVSRLWQIGSKTYA